MKSRFFAVSAFILLLMSCSVDGYQESPEETLPELYQKNSPQVDPEVATINVLVDGITYSGEIYLYWDNEAEIMNQVLVSQNLLDDLQTTQDVFNQMLEDETDMTTNSGGDDDDEGTLEGSPFAQCMEYCQQTYTDENGKRKKGRGNCRLGCWVSAAERVATALAENLSLT